MATREATQATAGRTAGFVNLDEELEPTALAVEGELPAWLTGTLVRVTPAQLDVGGTELRHWFDGLAMLNAFTIDGDGVTYANRYLDTEIRRQAHRGDAAFAGFAQDPCRSLFKRVTTTLARQAPSNDNTNVNLTRLGERYVAMTELPMPVEFDPATLRTIGPLRWNDTLDGQVTTAHPHHDAGRRELVNHLAHLGPRSSYRVYAVTDGSLQRREIARIPVREPGYMHSFALSERFVVLVEFPLVVNPLHLALSGRSFIDNFRWEPERGTRFLVVDRERGCLHGTWETEAFFSFHHVNAFERDGRLVIDLCAYDDPSIIGELEIARLRDPRNIGPVALSVLRRYEIPLDGGKIEGRSIAPETAIELPRINYGACNMRPYQHVYGVGTRTDESDWLDQLVRIDVESGESLTWHEPSSYPGEPVFVARPGATEEDDGVIVSVVLDGASATSSLVVLDAVTLRELARARAPHTIPFGFHGQFLR
jgi:carotenoid cleavage dioxygenase-like enzyme